jgi:hypothetical protein
MYSGNTTIFGQGRASSDTITAWFASRGPSYAPRYAPDGRYQPPAADLGAAIVAECRRYPDRVVNHDLVAAQILHETAAWQSRYARERNNPGGIGAVNNNPDLAHWFPSVAAGVRAHVAHLLVYAVGDGPWSADTPRRDAVAARGWFGVVRTWADLNGRWAYPGSTYGQQIATLANNLTDFANNRPLEAPMIRGLVDIRGMLRTATDGNRGPFERTPMAERRGVVVHYNGPRVDRSRPTIEFLKGIATYHVDRNWTSAGQPPIYGSGIMYHIGIGDDGVKYQLRDLGRVLWHCGAWPQNRIALAIFVTIGGDQRATSAQLRALREVVDDWRAATNTPRAEVWGHEELQGTSCPGTLMADFVYPYRKVIEMTEQGRWFPETGHYVGGGFWQYWINHGGLSIFGYPLTDEILEAGRTVQYFERAVMEWHPENQPPYDILLRRLGADALDRRDAA